MELVLTQADLDVMPAELRLQLFTYLGRTRGPGELDHGEGELLSREQAIGLLREVSFHRAGARLRVLLERLVHDATAKPPSRKRMIEALEEDGAQLGRYLATLNRITAKVTGRPDARLCEYQKAADAYRMHAETREILRDLLVTMKASGKQEEPLWE
jgi:hypothetical protein